MEEFANFCRACLVKYDNIKDLINYSESKRRQFIYSTGIQIKQNDVFPFQLCVACHSSMVNSCKFRKQCRNSDKRLQNYLATRDSLNIGFSTFLTNIDDCFRIPYKTDYAQDTNEKDDDNVSTSTSIRAFMNNLLKETDIPAEESLINRVIEEMDLLEDSLDSNWIGEDDKENFLPDFSPFSTPLSTNEDRCNKFINISDDNEPTQTETYPDPLECHNKDVIDRNLENALQNGEYKDIIDKNIRSSLENGDYIDVIDKNLGTALEIGDDEYVINRNLERTLQNGDNNDTTDQNLERALHYEVKNDTYLGKLLENSDMNDLIDQNLEKATQNRDNKDVIDENLERALENGETSFDLDELLKSPATKITSTPLYQPNIEPKIPNLDKVDTNSMNCLNELDGITLPSHYDPNKEQNLDKIETNSMNFYIDIDKLIEDVVVSNTETLKPSKPTSDEITNNKCVTCNLRFLNFVMLMKHFEGNHEVKLAAENLHYCNVCQKQFNSAYGLRMHKKIHGKPSEKHVCTVCTLEVNGKSRFIKHMASHGFSTEEFEKLQCEICNKKFNHKVNFLSHMDRHQKKISAYCNECGKGFVRKAELITHLRSHSPTRTFKCKACLWVGKNKKTLNQHIKRNHSGSRYLACIHCGKNYDVVEKLRKHLLTSKNCQKYRFWNELEQVGSVNIAQTSSLISRLRLL